jgi:deazaflavin-dependent oxidoreductase (nitroreductase family)
MGLQDEIGFTVPQANSAQRLLQRIGATRPGTALMRRVLPPLDRMLRRISRGRTSVSRVLGALPLVWLGTVGARSGQPRSHPLTAIPLGEDLALIGTYFGSGTTPAWAHNLRAQPAALLTYNDSTVPVFAREADPSEAEQAFAAAIAIYPGYSEYRQRAAMPVPVFVLTSAEERRSTDDQ